MLDYAKVKIKAGDGGKGLVGFRREKYVPKGGPDGGDGGRGGDFYIEASNSVSTLLDFQFLDHFDAQSGEPGGTSNKHGKDGQDFLLKVPVGSIIRINKLVVDAPINKRRKGEVREPNKYQQKVFNYKKIEKQKNHEELLKNEAEETDSVTVVSNEQPITHQDRASSNPPTELYQKNTVMHPGDDEESFLESNTEVASEEYKIYDFSNQKKTYASSRQAQNNALAALEKDERPVFDMDKEGMRIMIAKGGVGGKGNARFKNSVDKAPKFAEPGQKGEYLEVEIILKMVANVGIIGLPNAGKSTLLSKLTAASPKIADYAFTTLEPNLGVMTEGTSRVILADIPGLIEGASQGKGLGFRFLQHIERTQLLLHIIGMPDIQANTTPEVLRDSIMNTYETVRAEIEQYGHDIPLKPEIIIINKIDKIPDDQRTTYIPLIEEALQKTNRAYGFVSAESEQGLNGLKKLIFDGLADNTNK